MNGKTVVVLGGGIGGIVAASELRKRLPRQHRVVLVDRGGRHFFPPSYLWVLSGWRKPRQVSRDLAVLARKGIEVSVAQVEEIDVAQSRVRTSAGSLDYDYLVVSLGADLAPERVPGLTEAAYNLYDVDSLVRLKDALAAFQGGSVPVVVSSLPYKCPAAPYEAALLIDYVLRRRGVREGVDLQLFVPEPAPLPVAGPAIGEAVQGLLEQRGIPYHPGHRLTSVDPDTREVLFENGARASFDLLPAVPPHTSPPVVAHSDLAAETGWVPVARDTLVTTAENVCAIGDVTAIPLSNGMPLPKAGVFAHGQAEVVARNIANAIRGEGTHQAFDGHGSCTLETGFGRAALASGNFYAEPVPEVAMRGPGRVWHWGKVLFEKRWMRRWF